MNDAILNSDIVADIKHVASKLGRCEGEKLGRNEYIQHGGRFSHYEIYEGGHTWEGYCNAAGYRTKKKEPVPDEVYFERIQRAVALLGRYPKTSERKQFGLNFRKSRYPTLRTFIERAVGLGIIEPELEPSSEVPVVEDQPVVPFVSELTNKMGIIPAKSEQGQPVPPIPSQTKRVKWERTGIEGFPYAPQDEDGVVALFAILCTQGRIGWQILDLNRAKGIDATCYDNVTQKEIQVELKHTLSRGSWSHRIEDIDYVVCWENRWPDFPKPVIELRQLIQKTSS